MTATKPTYDDLLGTLETLLHTFDDELPAEFECDPAISDILNYINIQVRTVVEQAKGDA